MEGRCYQICKKHGVISGRNTDQVHLFMGFCLVTTLSSYDRMKIVIYVHNLCISHDFLFIVVISSGLVETETSEATGKEYEAILNEQPGQWHLAETELYRSERAFWH